MAERSVRFDFLGRDVSASRTAHKVAREFDGLEDHLGKSGHGAGKKFREGFGDGVDEKGGISRIFKNLVRGSENTFTSLRAPLAKALSTPLGLGIAAALTTTLAVAIPSAVAIGLGGGLIAIGAFALRGSTILKKHFKAAGSAISESLRQAAQPLKGPFLQAIESVTGAMIQLQPQFRGLFKAIKPSIKPFVDGFIGFVRQVVPGLQAAMPGINAAFAQMGARLPGLGKTIGGVFAAISSNLPMIKKGVDILFTLTEVVVNVTGASLTLSQVLAQAFGAGISAVTGPLKKVWEYTLGLHGAQKQAAGSAKDTANSEGALAIAAQKAGAAHQALMDKAKATRAAFYQERAAVASVIPIFDGYSNKSTVTKGKILANLREELAAYKGWAQNTQTLLKRGADPAVVKALSDKGPQYVAAFVNASDSELADLNGIFKGRTQAAGSVATAAAGVAGGAMGRAATAGFAANFHPNLSAGLRNPGGGGKGGRGAGGHARPSLRGRPLANGGILREPVAGIGLRSGTSYLMGERGPEAVVPLRGGRGGGAVTIVVNGVTDPRAVALRVRDELVRHQGRNGTTGLR